MAVAKKNTRTEVVVTSIELTLTPEEAKFLADVMSMVGGSMISRRKHAAALITALNSVGVKYSEYPIKDVDDPATTIYFREV
jgi:hypothetical protein